MAWVTWRQHRIALAGLAVFLCAIAVCLWILGLELHHAYADATACHPATSLACSQLVRKFNGMDDFLANGSVLQAVPALIGAFAGAPVLARELETGTFRYAWTQGIGRWRWTLAKLSSLAVVVAAASGVLSVLFAWYYQPYLANSHQTPSLSQASPLAATLFDLRGVAFAAWTLAAFVIGALAGMLIRRGPGDRRHVRRLRRARLRGRSVPASALPHTADHQHAERAQFGAHCAPVGDQGRQARLRRAASHSAAAAALPCPSPRGSYRPRGSGRQDSDNRAVPVQARVHVVG
jgi:hypothetical protein